MAKVTRTVERTETITLPPGTYYVGDPCFAIGDDNWAEFRKSFPARNTASMMDGHKSAVFGGFGGFGRDGPRRDDNGQTYQVESGFLAAIPQALMTKTPPGLEEGWNGRMTTFYDQFDCHAEFVTICGVLVYHHGQEIHIGDIIIHA